MILCARSFAWRLHLRTPVALCARAGAGGTDARGPKKGNVMWFQKSLSRHGEEKSVQDMQASSIFLVKNERLLFNDLDKVRAASFPHSTVRVAGGWVRDKMLGRTSKDIDIALEGVDGVAFAEKVQEFMQCRSKEKFRKPALYIVKKNPAQSKHLESACMTLYDLDIDFVQLRDEEYSMLETDKRIPVSVTHGTPESDAHRRDLTINALFYNIGENKVEDFTGHGIADIDAKIIRTPPGRRPNTTLLEDPLRALRALRFAVTLDFEVHDELWNAIKDPGILNALRNKVSGERMQIEFVKMIKHLGHDRILAYTQKNSRRSANEPLPLLEKSGFHNVLFPLQIDSVDEKNGKKSVGNWKCPNWNADHWAVAKLCSEAAVECLAERFVEKDLKCMVDNGNGKSKDGEDLLLGSVLAGINVCIPEFHSMLPERRGGALFKCAGPSRCDLNHKTSVDGSAEQKNCNSLPFSTLALAYAFHQELHGCQKKVNKMRSRYIDHLKMSRRILNKLHSISCGACLAPLDKLPLGRNGLGLAQDEQLAMAWAWVVALKNPDEIEPALAISRVLLQHRWSLCDVDSLCCEDEAAASVQDLRDLIIRLGGGDHIFEQAKNVSFLSAEEVIALFPKLARSPQMQPVLFSIRLWTALENAKIVAGETPGDASQGESKAKLTNWLMTVVIPNLHMLDSRGRKGEIFLKKSNAQK